MFALDVFGIATLVMLFDREFSVELSLLEDGDLARFAFALNQCLMEVNWLRKAY